MKKHMIKVALLGALGLASLSASATVVNYTFDAFGTAESGSFAGTDSNNDNFLTLNELSAFSFSYDASMNVSSLYDFGSFDLANNVWNADGAGWGNDTGAYFSWDGGNLAATTSNIQNLTTSIVASDVPEPASIALFGLGVLGFAAARRRQQ